MPYIQEFVDRKRRRKGATTVIVLTLLLAGVVALEIGQTVQRHNASDHAAQHPGPPGQTAGVIIMSSGTVTGGIGSIASGGIVLSRDVLRKAQPEQKAAFDRALAKWTSKLGRLPIPKPDLQAEPQYCGVGNEAIACADMARNRIIVSGPMDSSCSWDTVMLHEVGHLLGVPHIEGDPLMDSQCRLKETEPSPDSLAIARAHMGKRE